MNQRIFGTLLSYVYMVLNGIVNILYVPILLNGIGQTEYGLYQVIGSIIACFTVMETSLSAGVLRYYCKYRALNDKEGMENILAISRRIYNFLSFFIAVVGGLGIIFLDLFYRDSFTHEELIESKIMFIILLFNLILTLKNYVYVAVINGNEKFIFLRILGIVSIILQPIGVIFFIRRFPYAIVMVLIQFGVNCVVLFVRKYYAVHYLNAKIILHNDEPKLKKSILNLSIQILLSGLADQIFWKTDQLIIGKVFGTSLVSTYSVGSQLYISYMSIGTAISSVFMPYISQLYMTENRDDEILKLFIKVGRISCCILLLVLSAFLLFGKEFINIWVGNGYEISYYIALIVMIPFTIDLVQNLALIILQVYNKYAFRAKMYFILAVTNIGLTIILIGKFGIIGAAFATGISMFIGNGIIMNIYYMKIGLNIKKFWVDLSSFITCVVPCLFCGHFLNIIILDNKYLQFGIHIFLYIVVYGYFMYYFVFNSYEKSLLIKGLSILFSSFYRKLRGFTDKIF